MFRFWKKRPPQPLIQRRWKWSKRISFCLHSLVVGSVVTECLLLVALPIPVEPPARQIVLHAPPLAEPTLQPVEINAYTPHPDNWLAKEAVDISHLEAAQADPRWELLNDPDLDARPAAEQLAASSFLEERLRQAIEDAEAKSAEENLERLKTLTGQLNEVSTEESVADITAQLGKLLGASPRASEPAKEPVAGEFEIDTAQLHDVRREELADGTFKYTAILIDAAGRTQETELSAAEGESAYRTFELIKQNPLLERVYRGIVMSLLDKMLRPKN
jgi:hypothetical protein